MCYESKNFTFIYGDRNYFGHYGAKHYGFDLYRR